MSIGPCASGRSVRSKQGVKAGPNLPSHPHQRSPEITLAQRINVHHARTKGGREEVDVVIELPGDKLLGIEIKASAEPKARDARHLQWLRAENPKRFIAGAVLHTGPDIIVLDDNIFAVPICAFWG